MKKSIFLIILFCFMFFCCKQKSTTKTNHTNEFKHLKSLKLVKKNSRNSYNLVYPNQNSLNLKPIKSCVILSAAIYGYISVLASENLVKGVLNPNYIYSSKIHRLIKNGQINSVGQENSINLEEIIKIHPDIIITSSNPSEKKYHDFLKKNGFKILYIDEYKEQNPLAKAEYIKLFGILFNKKEKADSIFAKVESNYNSLKQKTNQIKSKPTAFVGIMYGDTWFMPGGGNTYLSNLLTDAGINYLWKNVNKEMLMLSFEEVFNKAKNAHLWLNISDIKQKKVLLNAYKKYQWFDAFQKNKLYSFSKQLNKQNGANNFYEEGSVRCDLILEDLMKIAHPQLFPDSNLHFYHKID